MGGLIILVGIAAAVFAWPTGMQTPALLAIGFSVIGFVDDYLWPRLKPGSRGLAWKPKLVLQLAAAWVPLLLADGRFMAMSIAMAVLIVAYANAFNFADGLDGLAGGIAAILGSAFALIGLHAGHADMVVVSASIAGGSIAFLFWNAPPAKVFMGDVGSLPIGALFGWLAIRSVDPGLRGGTDFLPVLILSLVLVAELVPVPLQILAVKLWKRRIFPATPIHHGFEVKGWPESRIVWTFLLVQAIAAAIGVTLACFGVAKA